VVFTGGSAWFVSRGAGSFATLEWGPQPLQVAWRGQDLFVGFYTLGDSGIKKPSDLKGKRIAQIPGYPTINNLMKGILAYAGLTLDDVKVVTLPSHTAGGKALTAGKIDVYAFGTTGSLPMETAASVHGIYWIPIDTNNREGIRRFLEYVPWTGFGPISRYAGKKEGDPSFISCIYPYCYYAYEGVEEEIVYLYAKGIWEGYDIFKNKSADLTFWDHNSAVNTVGTYYPFHNGLIKLLKEKGVWNSELERFQKDQLAKHSERTKLWKRFIDKAKDKKLEPGSEPFQDAWWEELKKADLLL
jgi:TRAP transporter TAXI family solute receptor